MKRLAAILTLSMLVGIGSDVYAQFRIDNTKTDRVKMYEKRYKKRYAKKIIDSWIKQNPDLEEKVVLDALEHADTAFAPRYTARPIATDISKLELYFNNQPVGYVELYNGKTSLGWVMVGETGNYIVVPNETPELATGGEPNEKSVRSTKLRDLIKEKDAFVVAGMGQEGVLFYQHEDRVMQLDVDTQAVRPVIVDNFTQDVEFKRVNRTANRTLAVLTKVVGGALVTGVIVLMLLM